MKYVYIVTEQTNFGPDVICEVFLHKSLADKKCAEANENNNGYILFNVSKHRVNNNDY